MNNSEEPRIAALELLRHAEDHRRNDSDFDRRMALIGYDQAIEVAIATFIQLPIDLRNGFLIEDRTASLLNFETKRKLLMQYVEALGIDVPFDLAEIQKYHDVRNELYHGTSSIVPSTSDLVRARANAIGVFKALFEEDVAELLVHLELSGSSRQVSQPPKDGRWRIQNSTASAAHIYSLQGLRDGETHEAGIVWQIRGTGLYVSLVRYLTDITWSRRFQKTNIIVTSDRPDKVGKLHELLERHRLSVRDMNHRIELARHTSELRDLLYSGVQVKVRQKRGSPKSDPPKLVICEIRSLLALEKPMTQSEAILVIAFDIDDTGLLQRLQRTLPKTNKVFFASQPLSGNEVFRYSLDQAINDGLLRSPIVDIRTPHVQPISSSIRNPSLNALTDLNEPSSGEEDNLVSCVAADLVSHFESRRSGEKSVILVARPLQATELRDAIVQLRPKWASISGSEVLIASITGRTNPSESSALRARFSDPNDRFGLAITTQLWWTGLAPELLNVLYLGGPVGQLAINQAVIAMTQPYRGSHKLIVDYFGHELKFEEAVRQLGDAIEPEVDSGKVA